MNRSILKTVVFALSCALLGNAVFAQAKKPLVVYFSVPEDVQTKGTEDAVSGASVVVRGGVKYGNTEFVAKTIQKETGADIFRIETVQDYPKSHNALLNAAQQEERKGTHPQLKGSIADFSRYDTVILCYPVWWYTLPMPVYSFLDS